VSICRFSAVFVYDSSGCCIEGERVVTDIERTGPVGRSRAGVGYGSGGPPRFSCTITSGRVENAGGWGAA